MKNITLILVAICLVTNAAFAQKEKKENRKACKAELKAYKEQNINPVMQNAYGQLVAGLSKEDAQFLEQKRAEERALKAELKDQRKTQKEASKGMDKDAKKEQMKALREDARKKKKALMESMKPFMERNEALIAKSMTTVKEKTPEWRAAKKAIKEKYKSDEQKEKAAQKGKGKQQKAKGKKKGGEHEKGHGAARLLFWDANKG